MVEAIDSNRSRESPQGKEWQRGEMVEAIAPDLLP
jgi:hypothetical protein